MQEQVMTTQKSKREQRHMRTQQIILSAIGIVVVLAMILGLVTR